MSLLAAGTVTITVIVAFHWLSLAVRIKNSADPFAIGQAGKNAKEIELHETVLPDTARSDTHVDIPDESEDVLTERKKVDNIPLTGDDEHSIVIRALRKVFPGTERNTEKVR